MRGLAKAREDVRVLIVDDHPCVIAGLMRLFEGDPRIRVVGSATCLREAEKELVATSPDVLLLDLKLGEESGFTFVPRVRALMPDVRIIVLSTYDDEIYRRHAESVGVNAYVAKSEDVAVLKEAIFRAGRDTGACYVTPFVGAALKMLSQAETQVIRFLAEGQSQKEASAALGISPSTVATHVQRAKEKMGVRAVSQLFPLVGLIGEGSEGEGCKHGG